MGGLLSSYHCFKKTPSFVLFFYYFSYFPPKKKTSRIPKLMTKNFMVLFGQGLRKLFSLGNGGNLCFSSYQADGHSLGQPDLVVAECLQKCCYV